MHRSVRRNSSPDSETTYTLQALQKLVSSWIASRAPRRDGDTLSSRLCDGTCAHVASISCSARPVRAIVIACEVDIKRATLVVK